MCFTTLGERGGKLHTTAHLGHRFSYATFQRPKRRLLEQILLFCSFVEQNFPVADETTCQRGKTTIEESVVHSESQAQTGIFSQFSSSEPFI